MSTYTAVNQLSSVRRSPRVGTLLFLFSSLSSRILGHGRATTMERLFVVSVRPVVSVVGKKNARVYESRPSVPQWNRRNTYVDRFIHSGRGSPRVIFFFFFLYIYTCIQDGRFCCPSTQYYYYLSSLLLLLLSLLLLFNDEDTMRV